MKLVIRGVEMMSALQAAASAIAAVPAKMRDTVEGGLIVKDRSIAVD